MPELPDPKLRPHPYRLSAPSHNTNSVADPIVSSATPYAELHVTTNFTFLTGASHPEEYIQRAAELGLHAIAITDVNSLAGIVRAHVAAKEHNVQLVVGCKIVAACGLAAREEQETEDRRTGDILLFPTCLKSYGKLCRLLTLGKRRAEKGECHLALHDVIEHHAGLQAVYLPPPVLDQHAIEVAEGLKRTFDDDRFSIAASCLYSADDTKRVAQVAAFCKHLQVPMVATNDAHYHIKARKPLQDVVTCIRHGCTIHDAGRRLFPHGERYLKSPETMARLFAQYPAAIARSVTIANRAANFSLDELKYQYPDEICPPGLNAMEYLTKLTWQGAAARGLAQSNKSQIEHELKLINELNYAPYFLTVYDLVKFARGRGILCQGRGAAANSAVCYCLGVTSVDPTQIDMLVERFISHARNEPPDIDIDFEHERREEVIQYIYQKYGRHRAALTAEVVSYRGRSAVREVGKALGLSLDCVDRLAKSRDWWDSGGLQEERLRELGINPNDRTIKQLIYLTQEILGFPRHLSQHVGGFVITQQPLSELVPIENARMADRSVIEWDKDDIDAMGMLKVDCLGLGMLTCIRKGLEFVWQKESRIQETGDSMAEGREDRMPAPHSPPLSLATVPREDPAVYDMLCKGDAIGVFQVESRAQLAMLPRLKPRCYYDLVIEVAIVRPGPIQGNMVHPYLRRRAGEETIEYPDDKVRAVLERTLGVPIFQEQAMKLAIVAAGFTAEEADQLRRTMAAWKRKGDKLAQFGKKLINGMLNNGYTLSFAERCFEQIKGFSEYGFPESHSASFAHLVYVSAWLKCHHPAAFAAALINSQPMGFYAPAQIIRDAQAHDVEVLPIDVNLSGWDCSLEAACGLAMKDQAKCPAPSPALRLGMRLVKGLRREEATKIEEARERVMDPDSQTRHKDKSQPIAKSIQQLRDDTGISIAAMKKLAAADAFQSMGLDRQHALWAIQKCRDEELPLFEMEKKESRRQETGDRREEEFENPSVHDHAHGTLHSPLSTLPAIPLINQVSSDYRHTGLSLKSHPVAFIREHLDRQQVATATQIRDNHDNTFRQGKWVRVAGIVICRQRPSTASGIVFITLEDETGISNLIVRPKIYEKYRAAARHSTVLLVHGRVERKHSIIHIMTHRMISLDEQMNDIAVRSRDFH